jgi:hypothetical protein
MVIAHEARRQIAVYMRGKEWRRKIEGEMGSASRKCARELEVNLVRARHCLWDVILFVIYHVKSGIRSSFIVWILKLSVSMTHCLRVGLITDCKLSHTDTPDLWPKTKEQHGSPQH